MWMKLEINPLNMTVTDVDTLMGRETVQCLAKNAISVVVRTTSGKCAGTMDLANLNLSQGMTQESRARPMEKADAHISVNFTK